MTWTQDQIDQTLRTIVEKSLHDRAFRALALKDSPGAVHAVSPTPLPTGFTVKFVDNAGADLTIVLPDATGAAREIDEEDLAGVAGGTIRFT